MSITSLPLELVREICSYLQLSELQALRLTDRKLYQQSLDTFSDRYFKSFRFLATSDGLRNLEKIAKVGFIRERVQELWMIPTIFEGTNRNKKRMSDYAVSSKSCERLQGASDVVFRRPVGFDDILKPHDATTVLTWFDLIIKVAPRLKVLAFSQGHYIGHDQPALPFGKLSRHIQFTQLKELHLHWIHLTSGDLKSFLTTAKPTLSTFTLFAVILDDRTSTQSLLWKLLWDFFRDELSLQRFSMAKIACDHQQYWIRGLDDLTEPSEGAEFDVETAGISFSKWIDRLTPVILNRGKCLWDIQREYQETRRMPSRVLASTDRGRASIDVIDSA
ncbi:hypothetical protein PENSOL_c009G04845 [Penicillium solitum]|uniref:F-box domain-containing protein n=1 Tax=Penicillium solitum TaxID=60172 RepID=A0A1V6RBD9_9EURO|nr:uncharacterized protein PENSOL_c009G04845 [Penicillium solitum]OQD98492.1 hypothetical protein PENSOL_c009G04845 [Penicillium solitum]